MQTLTIKKTTTGGFSLLELLLVVAVAAVLILAGIAAYSLVTNNQRSTDAKRQLAQIKSTIKTNYSTNVYTGVTTAIAGGMGAFTGMRGVTPTVTNAPLTPWGGAVTIAAPAANRFRIIFAGVPRAACSDAALALANDQDLVSVQVGAAAVRNTNIGTNAATQVTANNIGTDCGATGASNITYIFQ